jgi:hypothetical protein
MLEELKKMKGEVEEKIVESTITDEVPDAILGFLMAATGKKVTDDKLVRTIYVLMRSQASTNALLNMVGLGQAGELVSGDTFLSIKCILRIHGYSFNTINVNAYMDAVINEGEAKDATVN